MSVMKVAISGMAGFALGAGLMMMPGNQKLKRQMLRQADHVKKMVKQW